MKKPIKKLSSLLKQELEVHKPDFDDNTIRGSYKQSYTKFADHIEHTLNINLIDITSSNETNDSINQENINLKNFDESNKINKSADDFKT